MNGELMNMVQLTFTAKHYLRTGVFQQSLTENPKISKYIFRFAARGDYPEINVGSREEWLRLLAERGAQDCKLIMPDEVDDFDQIAQINGIRCAMLCFNEDCVTTWNKLWNIDAETGKWVVILMEGVIDNPPKDKPRFKDVSQDMATLLGRIRGLAQKLELSEFAFAFNAAQKSLQANFVRNESEMTPSHRRLLQAAIDAYVFDGPESWQAKARFAAAGKGLADEYETLTKQLFQGIALSIMYAVNEW